MPYKTCGMDACADIWGLVLVFLASWSGSGRLSVQVLVGSCVMLVIFGCPAETGTAGVARPEGPTKLIIPMLVLACSDEVELLELLRPQKPPQIYVAQNRMYLRYRCRLQPMWATHAGFVGCH